MPRAAIDHLTVTAPSLAAGLAYVEAALGVRAQPGGAHPRMGTHNCLLKLGPALFLEIIAVDPAAPAPARPRWFGLDRLQADCAPRLATWVVRTDDIRAAVLAAPPALGAVEPMERGSLHWLITIPANGELPLDGILPTLIEWGDQRHPAHNLAESGCTLRALEAWHPEPQPIARFLAALGLADAVQLRASPQAGLRAHIDTPAGPRTRGL